MAEYGSISYDMQEKDPEFYALDPDARHCWLSILGTRWAKPGIVKLSELEFVTAQRTGRPAEVVRAALTALNGLGWIVIKDDWAWIRGWIKHHDNSPNWYYGARKDALELLASTDLAALCLERYPEKTAFNDVKRGRPPLNAAKPQHSTAQHSTEQLREEKEKREDSLPAPVGAGGASKAAGRSANGKREATPAELELLPLFERLEKIIATARADAGLSAARQDRDKALLALEQSIRLNGLQAERIEAACRWSFSAECPSLDFNLDNLSFIHRWRKVWANGPAVVCMVDKYNRRDRPPRPAGRYVDPDAPIDIRERDFREGRRV